MAGTCLVYAMFGSQSIEFLEELAHKASKLSDALTHQHLYMSAITSLRGRWNLGRSLIESWQNSIQPSGQKWGALFSQKWPQLDVASTLTVVWILLIALFWDWFGKRHGFEYMVLGIKLLGEPAGRIDDGILRWKWLLIRNSTAFNWFQRRNTSCKRPVWGSESVRFYFLAPDSPPGQDSGLVTGVMCAQQLTHEDSCSYSQKICPRKDQLHDLLCFAIYYYNFLLYGHGMFASEASGQARPLGYWL